MERKYPHLCKPIRIGSVWFRNRMFSTPMGGTAMTFYPDGSYRFFFESYGIEDLGSYTCEGGVLTLTDANGVKYTADGETLHLHYGYSGAPDQLTGEYTIDPAIFA